MRAPDEGERVRAAMARERQLSLAEVMSADTWVTGADGSLMPQRLADRGDQGWDGPSGAAADRDSTQAARLAVLVRHMDELAAEYERSLGLMGADLERAMLADLAFTWIDIRKITQGRG